MQHWAEIGSNQFKNERCPSVLDVKSFRSFWKISKWEVEWEEVFEKFNKKEGE